MAKQNEKPDRRTAKLSRYAAATQVIRELEGPTTLSDLLRTAQKLFADTGGKCSEAAMLSDVKAAIRSGEMFNLVTTKRNELTVTPVKA
jgi:hypothetical protein